MSNDEIKIIPVKPYTLKELAAIYGLHRDTMRAWLKPFQQEIGTRVGYYYNIGQVKIIFQKLKLPSFFQVKDETKYFD